MRKSEGPGNDAYPANIPVVWICRECNQSFSCDEDYLRLFLHCVLAGSTNPGDHSHPAVRRALERHGQMRAQIEGSKTQVLAVGRDPLPVWIPDERRVKRVVLKNAKGHAFFELGHPVWAKEKHVWAKPLVRMTQPERRVFFEVPSSDCPGWPEVGSRMMTRLVTGQDVRDAWIVVQEGVYRYRVEQTAGLFVKSILFEYLATETYWEDVA